MLETVAQIINGHDIDNTPWIEKWRVWSNERVQNSCSTLSYVATI